MVEFDNEWQMPYSSVCVHCASKVLKKVAFQIELFMETAPNSIQGQGHSQGSVSGVLEPPPPPLFGYENEYYFKRKHISDLPPLEIQRDEIFV